MADVHCNPLQRRPGVLPTGTHPAPLCLTGLRSVVPLAVAGGLRGNLLQAAHSVVTAHGAGALYKGFRASLIGDVLGNALGFTAYEIGNR